MNKVLWAVAKFFNEQDQFSHTSPIARFCFEHFPDVVDKATWWATNWSAMRRILNAKRNAVSQRFYKPFKGESNIINQMTGDFAILIYDF